MSIPLIISLLISSIYGVIDAVWVAGLGADALAGVGFVNPLFVALIGIGNGLGAGSTSAISKYIGMNDKSRADNAAAHTIIITILISVFVTAVLFFFLKDILTSIGAAQTIGYAMDYADIIVLGSISIILSNSIYGMLRGEADAKTTMYAMIFSSVLNIVLDPILIYMLDMGVRGAAIATIISFSAVDLILLYYYYIRRSTFLKPYPSNFTYDTLITMDILKVGLPASLELINNALFAAMFSLLLSIVSGTDAVAVYSTGWRIVTIATTPILAISTALITVIAVNYGAHNYENMQIAHRYSMKLSIISSIISAVIILLFASQIVGLFVYSSGTVRIAPQMIHFLSVIVFFFPTMAVGCPSTYVFQGTGHGITAMFQTILRETVFTITFAFFLAVILNMGEYGAWLGVVLGELVVNNITLIWADHHIKSLIKTLKS